MSMVFPGEVHDDEDDPANAPAGNSLRFYPFGESFAPGARG
jgi:hypothetical protein